MDDICTNARTFFLAQSKREISNNLLRNKRKHNLNQEMHTNQGCCWQMVMAILWCSCASLIVDQLGLWLFMTLLNYLLFCLLTDCLTTGDWSHIGFTAQPQPPSPPFLLPGNNKDPPNPVAARTKAPKQHPVITTMAVPGFIFGGWKSAPTKNPLKISSQTWGKSSKSRMGPLIWKAN